MSKIIKINKILAVIAGICASIPQVGAIPAGVKGKNDVKLNGQKKMDQSNMKGKEVGIKTGVMPRSKSMGSLAGKVKSNKKTVSLAQNTKPTEPNVKSTKSEVNVVKNLGSTFWRN